MATATAFAEETKPGSRLVESYTKAEVIERAMPKFPERAVRNRSDGWVQLSYVIDKEGNVKDIVPVNHVGDKRFITEAKKAVKKWKFEPATANGEPIEQCDNAVQLDFLLSGGAGVSRRFNSAMFSGRNALEEGDLESVKASIEKMDTSKSTNITEVFWRNHLAISLYNRTGEEDKKHQAVVKALDSMAAVNLEDDQKVSLESYLLQEKFVYLANHRRYSSALSSFERLKQLDPESASNYDNTAKKIETLVASDKPIVVSAEMDNGDRWHHNLARRTFALKNIEGRLDKLEIRCSRKYRSFTISDDAQWQIPEDWGQCNIHVLGEQNSKFKLVEI